MPASVCHGELVAVFDADFIPQHRFLELCIGFLQEPDVALLQTPQAFINADPVMRNLRMERGCCRMRRVLPLDRTGAGRLGSRGLRRHIISGADAALDQVGGFVEGALSEDFVTGIALREQGWRSALPAAETQCWTRRRIHGGLCAAAATLGQRHPAEPAPAPGASASPRPQPGPTAGLPGRRGPLAQQPASAGADADAAELRPAGHRTHSPGPAAIIELMLPLWGTVLLSIGWLNRNSRSALLTELTGWVLTVPLVTTLISHGLGSSMGFRVTPKHRQRSQGGWAWFLALP